MSLGDNSADVDKAQGGVARTLDPDEAGVISDVLADVDLDLRGEGDLDTVGLGYLGEVSVGSTVDIGDGNDVTTSGKALENDSSGGATAREGEGIAGMLESGDGGLEVGSVGVGGSRVLVLADGLANGRLGEGGGEGDGLNHGASDRVVGGAGVHSKGTKAVDGGRSPRGGIDNLGNDRRRHGCSRWTATG